MVNDMFYSLQGPLDTLPGDEQIRAAHFQYFPELVRQLGGDPRRILARHGIDPLLLRDPDQYVGSSAFLDVCEYCSSVLEFPLFGLRLAELQDPDMFGCVGAVCRAAPTFGEAVHSFVKYHPVVQAPSMLLELVKGKETTELRYWPRMTSLVAEQKDYLQAQHRTTLSILKLFRQIGGPTFRASYVLFLVAARRKDIPDIEDKLACASRNGDYNAIAFPTHMLQKPLSGASKHLYRLVSGYLERLAVDRRISIVQRVEDHVRGSLLAGNCAIEKSAEAVGMSSRTLQAHLHANGLRFSEIVEQQRIKLAKIYLDRGNVSLGEVASSLGYAGQSSFGRAFKRWTGATPQSYRIARERQRARA